MFPGEIFTSFAEFQGIVSVNDFWFPLGFQELLQASLGFLVKFCFLHGYAWIHWVAKSCTTTADRWLFRDSQLSLRTLWSAVIKSPKLTARSTASPLRLLHGALVILVRLQISQFRSSGKWVWTLCLPKSSRLLVVGSKETSLEELAWEPPCNGFIIHQNFHEFLQPFGIWESQHGFHRSVGVLFLLGFLDFLAWVLSDCPDLSSTNSDTGTGEMSLLFPSSRSRTGISPTVVKKVRMKKMKKNDSPVS